MRYDINSSSPWCIASEVTQQTCRSLISLAARGMIATRYEGSFIPPPHGGRARLLVPHLYFGRARIGCPVCALCKGLDPASGTVGLSHLRRPLEEQRYEAD